MAFINPIFLVGSEVDKESKHILVTDQTLHYAETLEEGNTGYASTDFIRAIFVAENDTIKPDLSQLTGYGMQYQFPVLNNRRYKIFMIYVPVYDSSKTYPLGVIVYKDGGFYKQVDSSEIEAEEDGGGPEIRANVSGPSDLLLWKRLTTDDYDEFFDVINQTESGSIAYPEQSIKQAVSYNNTDWQDYSVKRIDEYQWEISDDSNLPGSKSVKVFDVEQNELDPPISFSIQSGETKNINLKGYEDGVFLVKIYNGSIEEMKSFDPNSSVLVEQSTKTLVIYEYSEVNKYVHEAMRDVFTEGYKDHHGIEQRYKRNRMTFSSFKIYSFFLSAVSAINFEKFEYIEHYMLTDDRYSVIKLADKYIKKALEMARNYSHEISQ